MFRGFEDMPTCQLSTIIGLAVAAFAALGQAFPHSPWAQTLGAAATLVMLDERKPG
jgi:hypothetical protein